MGLDMYAYSATLTSSANTQEKELHYWRKHPNLHGWMHQLYLKKGGDPDDNFNGTRVWLDIVDVVKLKLAISAGILPETSGFFFGESTGEEMAGDIQFCDDAAAELSKGNTVFYTSSW